MILPRVLIVEDEFLIRDVVEQDFSDEGFIATTAENAIAAMALLRSEPPYDLLFTDIRMPGGMDGWKLGKLARAEQPGIKVIYATGYAEQTRQLEHFERFIRKPYHFSELLTLVRELGIGD